MKNHDVRRAAIHHETEKVIIQPLVEADVDVGISRLVQLMNLFPGVRTTYSCQGCRGGRFEAASFDAYVSFKANDTYCLRLLIGGINALTEVLVEIPADMHIQSADGQFGDWQFSVRMPATLAAKIDSFLRKQQKDGVSLESVRRLLYEMNTRRLAAAEQLAATRRESAAAEKFSAAMINRLEAKRANSSDGQSTHPDQVGQDVHRLPGGSHHRIGAERPPGRRQEDHYPLL